MNAQNTTSNESTDTQNNTNENIEEAKYEEVK